MRKVTLATVVFSLLMCAAATSAVGQEATPTPTINVGSTAPDFTLRDQNGKQVSLHDFRGKKNVVLAFYVFAFTGG